MQIWLADIMELVNAMYLSSQIFSNNTKRTIFIVNGWKPHLTAHMQQENF
jgi:hypothetical protein